MNLVVIMDDEHNKKMLGHAGHPQVKTPHLDRMAAPEQARIAAAAEAFLDSLATGWAAPPAPAQPRLDAGW